MFYFNYHVSLSKKIIICLCLFIYITKAKNLLTKYVNSEEELKQNMKFIKENRKKKYADKEYRTKCK